MYIDERKDLFRNSGNRSNPYRIMLILLVIVVLVAVALVMYELGEME